jgi:acyl transferase domain-containing protein
MESRLALAVRSVPDLVEQLQVFLGKHDGPQLTVGNTKDRDNPNRRVIESDPVTEQDYVSRNLDKLALLWAAGENPDWDRLYAGRRLQRVSLPNYPFRRDRYWLDPAPERDPQAMQSAREDGSARISVNLDRLLPYLVDHPITGRPALPGAVIPELVRQALDRGDPEGRFKALVWRRPLFFDDPTRPRALTLVKQPVRDAWHRFTLVDSEDDEDDPYMQFQWSKQTATSELTQSSLPTPIASGKQVVVWDADRIYRHFADLGFHYGPAFRPLQNANPSCWMACCRGLWF